MGGWTDDLATALGVGPLTPEEESRLLAAARDVAHGVERRATPLAAFLIGAAVERRVTGGADRAGAVADVLAILEAALPEAEVGDLP